MLKLRAKDTVKVLLGKDKGREGVIERVLPKKKTLIIPGINMYKRHVKGGQGQKSGIYDIPRPISVGKVIFICPKCKKTTRIGLRKVGEEKVRVCKKCKKEVDTK